MPSPRIQAAIASGSTIALVLGAGVLAWLSAGRLPPPSSQATPGPATTFPKPSSCAPPAIGIVGDLAAPHIVPYLEGARLRLDQYATEHPQCPVVLKPYDTASSTEDATAAARALADDASVLGVIGGIYSPETAAVLPALQEAGLAMISPGATRTNLTATTETTGPRVFHRIVASDHEQGRALGGYLRQILADDVFVLDDSTPYGTDLADGLIEGLAGQVPYQRGNLAAANGYAEVLAQLVAIRPSHVFYAGRLEAVPTLLPDMRAAGLDAQLLEPETLLDAAPGLPVDSLYVGAIALCACAPPPDAFAEQFLRAFGHEPGPGAVEGYDAATIFVDTLAGGASTRTEVLFMVDRYDRDGLRGRLSFDEHGEPVDPVVWSYRITPTGVAPMLPLTVRD